LTAKALQDRSAVCRASPPATITDVYMQELPEGVRASVDSIHHELKGTMKKLAAKAGIRPPAAATRAMVR